MMTIDSDADYSESTLATEDSEEVQEWISYLKAIDDRKNMKTKKPNENGLVYPYDGYWTDLVENTAIAAITEVIKRDRVHNENKGKTNDDPDDISYYNGTDYDIEK